MTRSTDILLLRTIRRPLTFLAIGLSWVATACDPIRQAGIALSPTPESTADSLTGEGLALVSRIVTQHGLRSIGPLEEFDECFRQRNLTVCSRITARELQVRFVAGGFKWSPLANTVRRDLEDALKSRFGAAYVRECEWTYPPDGPICTALSSHRS